jgi:uncharacterized protein YbjT (DUF2867 family)
MAVLGASGGVGRRIVGLALDRSLKLSGTRDASACWSGRVHLILP